MKKLTLITVVSLATVGYFVTTGYKEGPAAFGTYDCTGAETGLANPTGCTAGSGCHAPKATATITVALELDSAGIPVTHYVGGMSYKVKITGTNNTTSNLPKFGFQIGSIKGAVPQVTPTNEGTWPSPYNAGTRYVAPSPGNYVVGVVEHDNKLAPTTGTGNTGTTYVESINWKAPTAGTGTVSFWAALNAVDNNDTADKGDLWDTAHMVITEEVIPAGINEVTANNGIKVYPNPCISQATFSLSTEATNASLSIFDITGKELKALPSQERK
jgi:hypothetical protein